MILVGAHLINTEFNTKSCRPRPTNVDCRPLEKMLTGTYKKRLESRREQKCEDHLSNKYI